MICNLHIENIAVIQRADVDFARGFCVLTGETGAGKSILIDSINAILGERTAKDLIRAGCSTATVVAEFENVSKECEDILKSFDVTCEDGTVIISRTITKQKSSAKINGVPVTNSALKSVAPYLVNIHGQHDSQQLLNPDKHFIYIDLLAKNEQLKNEYKSAFSLMQKTRKQVLSFNENVEKREKQIALLEHAVDELSKADLQSGEMEKLQSRREQLLKNKDAAKMLNSALAALDGEQGILAHHEDTVMVIEAGEMSITTEKETIHAFVGSGFIEMIDNQAVIVVISAERPEDIDEFRANQARERANEELRQQQSMREYFHSTASLARAMERLKLKNKYNKI